MNPYWMIAKKLGKKEYLAQQEKMQKQRDRRAWKDEGPLVLPDSAMSLAEREKFREKMQDEYGSGWEEIVRDYGNMVNPQTGPAGQMTEPQMSFDPTRFRTDNPLSLLSNREDIGAVLREPTKQEYANELYASDPDALFSPPVSHLDMMRRDGTPVLSQEEIYAQQPPEGVGGGYKAGLSPWQGYSLGTTSYDINDPEIAGTSIPFPEQTLRQQADAMYRVDDPSYPRFSAPDQMGFAQLPVEEPPMTEPPRFQSERFRSYDPSQEGLLGSPSPQDRFNNRSWISRIHSPDWEEDAATSMNKQPTPENGALLGDGTTGQTGYNKSNRFNNIMAQMLMQSGFNQLNRNRDW